MNFKRGIKPKNALGIGLKAACLLHPEIYLKKELKELFEKKFGGEFFWGETSSPVDGGNRPSIFSSYVGLDRHYSIDNKLKMRNELIYLLRKRGYQLYDWKVNEYEASNKNMKPTTEIIIGMKVRQISN